MKGALMPMLRRASATLAVSLAFVGCNDTGSNPETVELDELKVARNLKIVDQGNGKIQLSWSGNNNEADFSGYNVFGAKNTDDLKSAFKTAGVESDGQVLQLLDTEGEPDENAKAVLKLMSYNGKDLETPAEDEPAAEGEEAEEPEFKAFPIYTTKDVFPSCLPAETTGTQVCAPKTEENKDSKSTFNGTATFEVDGLKVGSEYCFLILSTLESGTKASIASSERRCVIPRWEFNITVEQDGNDPHHKVDMKTLGEDCAKNDTCADMAKADLTDAGGWCDQSTEDANFCVESIVDSYGLTAVGNAGIRMIGFRPLGFDDPNLLQAPTLSNYTDGGINGGGYSLSGHTVPIKTGDMLVVAYSDGDDTDSFSYQWIYVKDATPATTGATATTGNLELVVRMAKNKDVR